MIGRFDYFLDVGMSFENKEIETERLYLRRFHRDDFEDFFEYTSSDLLMRQLGWPSLKQDRDVAFDFFRTNCLQRATNFAIVHKESGKVIGNFGIGLCMNVARQEILFQLNGITLSFAISEAYQRQGYMDELLTFVIKFLFDHYPLHYINCGYFHFNEASKALQTKHGFLPFLQHYVTVGEEKFLTIENILLRDF